MPSASATSPDVGVLYRPEDFEPLTDEPWDAERIRAGVAEIVADADDAFRGPKLLWRADGWDRWHATSPLKDLYVGAAGVVWALDELRRRGHAESRLDLSLIAQRALERQRERPDLAKWPQQLPEPREAALLSGDAGILLIAFGLAPSPELGGELLALVRANVANEAEDVMWGAAGSLVVAKRMLDWTGEERWRAAWDETANALLSRRDDRGLWTQRLHGDVFQFLGPAHGLTGNVLALRQRLDDGPRAALEQETSAVLERTAFVEDGLANWPPVERPALESQNGEIRVQWCHGAPGMVVSAAEYLDDELLLAGAELAWQAGPHGDEKGPSICHGTAGNGYAFLKTFARTGDERWLERARRFAVHALAQLRRERTARGRGRYSLWTGDLGVALYLADCVDARSAYPVLDA